MGKLDGKVALITVVQMELALVQLKDFLLKVSNMFLSQVYVRNHLMKLDSEKVSGVQGDVSNLDDYEKLFDVIKKKKGRLVF